MEEFEKRYKALNANQKKAVDTIDGPVMVVAGPGTGKTELLSVRVANILQKTDVLPGNILCLTFTDSGTVAMRERLAGLLGPQAYKVAIHTFHSFGSEIINHYGEYFYQGAHFRPADELASYEMLSGLLEALPHDNPLSSKLNDKFTYLGDIQTSISELKRGGFTPDELEAILVRNDAFIAWLKPRLADALGDRVSKKTLPLLAKLIDEIESYDDEPLELPGYHALSTLVAHSLERSVKDAEEEGSTKPVTAWKNAYLEKDAHGNHTLKDERRSEKLHALSKVYYDYLLAMQKAELYDYDDMILRVVHALEVFDELRFSLQEQYQYILVDEFQDTNDAQMRLVWNLTNNPAMEGKPNLMVVGDDDQAIYRFQGAELSNILDFTSRYGDVTVVALTDNYRSVAQVLDLSRQVITQAEERLENSLMHISKVLTPHHTSDKPLVVGTSYATTVEARNGLADAVKSIATSSQSTAIIARHHRELVELLPHLSAAGIRVRYERQENVLDTEPVVQLELVAHILWHLSREEFDEANVHLSELLAHPAWGVSPKTIWELSLSAYKEKRFWLEIMLEKEGPLKEIAEWLIVGANHAKIEPLEFVLDYCFGIDQPRDQFTAPYMDYFFGKNAVMDGHYLAHLSALQKIRGALRDYRPGKVLKLDDFVEYLGVCRELGVQLSANTELDDGDSTVTLLSAHKAKGLEFDTVFITDAHESVWGSSARSRSRLLSFPTNLPLSPAGDEYDERLRLLYVALTRARNGLHIVTASTNEQGKTLLPVGALGSLTFEEQPAASTAELIEAHEHAWYSPLANVAQTDRKELLRPILEKYRLSATHLNNYLDISKGGPEYFLLHNLLRIPEAMSPSAAYGSAVHGALQRAHQHLAATSKKRPVEDVIKDFETLLLDAQLSERDQHHFLERGAKALTAFLDQRYNSFQTNQRVEQNFSGEAIQIGDARITGAIDLLDIDTDEKTIFVTDYKTGKAAASWKGTNEHEKIKLHHYEQQLMMYKLLIENSRQFAGYTVTGARLEFVEPDARGEVVLLEYIYDNEKIRAFSTLLAHVWKQIMTLDFTCPDTYSYDLKGMLEFEQKLIGTDI
jgi:DNA helicase-2/ATP-dependent DNA helicase PcrA